MKIIKHIKYSALLISMTVPLSVYAMQTEEEFINKQNPSLVSAYNDDGTYNFNNKTRVKIVHDDGTIEYPLLNSGKLIPSNQPQLSDTPNHSQ